jgi:hypothetical protein
MIATGKKLKITAGNRMKVAVDEYVFEKVTSGR